ncbi:MAG: hypothetical protein K6E35_01815 [Bacteroidales bacterium]|nr:hypothetical protein [Bacteroidales bacterium]
MRNRGILSVYLLALALTLDAQEPVRSQGQSLLFRPDGDFTRAELGGRIRTEDEAFLPAEGRGLVQGEFRATARHWLDSLSRVEGSVLYERGVKRAVRWNTSSDWALLAPYVTLDSLGGDLQKEQYSFQARYARTIGRAFAEAAIRYRALHEYRDFDPRPRNITADLEFLLSGGVRVGRSALALEAGYRKYHQNGFLSFMDPHGHNTSIIHYLGLGRHYDRFSGSSASMDIRFRGDGFSAALRLEPRDGMGWTGCLSYTWLDIVRQVKGQNEAPMSSLLHQKLLLRGGYKWGHASVFADLSYRLRQGTEHVLDQTGAFLPLLDLTLYLEPTWEAALSGTVESSGWIWAPSARFASRRAEGIYPARHLALRYVEAQLPVAYVAPDGPWTWNAGLTLGAHATLSSACQIPDSLLDERFREYYSQMYARFSDHALSASLRGGIERHLRDGLSLLLAAEAGYTHYFTGHYRIDGHLSFGIMF